MPDDDIGQLTAAVASGQVRAVETFYRSYFDVLYRAAVQATGRDEAFCLDVVQESVLRVLRSIRRVDTEAQLVAWLRLVARSTAYDTLRAEQRRRQREQAVAAAPDRSETSPGPDAEHLAWLAEQLDRLDPKLRRLLDMRFRRGWTLAARGRSRFFARFQAA